MRHVHLFLGALLLGSCAPQPTPPQASGPDPVPGASQPAPSVPAPGTPAPAPQLTPLGQIEIAFSGLNDPAGFKAEPVAQGLTDIGGIQLEPLANGSFTVGQRGAGGVRYLYASFRVRNATSGGVAYGAARQNLTLVAASTAGTIGETAISNLQRFDGSAASPAIAQSILPTHAMTLDRTSGLDRVQPKLGSEDLQVFAEDEVAAAPAGVTRLFPYGFVVRRKTVTNSRLLPANPAAGQYDGVVTIAMKLPLQANSADDPFRFNMNFAVMDDSRTRVTESVEEQGAASDAAARAAALGAGTPVMTLCGSTLNTGTTQFIGSATTAGNAARLAKIGGNIALKNVALAYTVPGNTRLSVPAGGGLAGAYSTYGGAALSFSGNSTRRGGTAAVGAAGDFTFTSKVGDGQPAVTDQLIYRVADNQGCSSTDTTADVNVAGRVWFVNNSGANGDGRQGTPFNTLAAAQTASAVGDVLYVARGTGTSSGQNSGLGLKNNQTLIGEGAALTVGGVTYIAAGAQPAVIGNSAGAGVTLAQNNVVRGLNISGTSSAVTGSNLGTLELNAGTLTATAGPALNLSTGSTVTVQAQSVSGTAGGILSSGLGTFTLTAGTVGASAGPALNLTGGTLNATITALNSSASPGTGSLLTGVGGTLSVTGSGAAGSGGTLQGAAAEGLRIVPQNQTLTATLDRLNVQNNGAEGVEVVTQNTETGRAVLTVRNSTFANNGLAAVRVDHAAGSASRTVLNNNTVNNTTSVASGFSVNTTHTAAQTDELLLSGNSVTLQPVNGGSSIGISSIVAGTGTLRVSAVNNTVNNFASQGLRFLARDNGSRLHVTLTGNQTNTTVTSALEGALLQSGDGAASSAQLCASVSSNTLRSVSGIEGLYVWKVNANTLQLQGFSGGNAQSFLASANPATVGITVDGAPTGGTCETPTP
ncbi:beta strand repeat-containing protein [Deinococcus multiflagellatus]|uniref:beta strand repeat-containing protein n=1 Tax=Deinococcus multiflagellatus TaxID=1656887 RepID=UPI001CCD4ED1|nr:VcbS [Deinococcus multiflagellatus]MBZ9713553.1 VcbS [Deinococcus multiflagellatus]